jgi:hypothetical protein
MATSNRSRLVLAAVGVFVFCSTAAFVLWQLFAPGDQPDFQIAGCDISLLNETFKPEGGPSYRDYDLLCVVRGKSPPPACDEVMARYLAVKGPLPKNVHVRVRGEDNLSPDFCHRQYLGDGSPL